jgi:hypothetical protein
MKDNFTQISKGYAVQGDVPIIRKDKLPENCKPVKGNVLRSGEVTGHHHVVEAQETDFQLYQTPQGELWMELFGEAEITHQEHGTIVVPTGIYVVPEQVEYDGAEERRVLD